MDYVYDPLQRLNEANYSNGDYYHYTLRQAQGKLLMPSATIRLKQPYQRCDMVAL